MKRFVIATSLSSVLVVLFFFPFRIPFYRDVYNNLMLDSYDHWLPCDALPRLGQIKTTMAQYQTTLKRLGRVDLSGRPSIFIEATEVCEGRGDILIEYGAHRHREQIEDLLKDRTFHGIPVRLRDI